MWPESIYFPVLAAVCVIAFTIVYAIWQRRETESQHETNVDTCLPATLLKHAQACKRNIHEVPRDDNSLFSALADQLTDATFTGQSLRDHIETFISGRCPYEQQESIRLQKSNSRQDTGPTIQDAADFLRHSIVLYRDDENPPFFFQPNVDVPDPNFQNLHIGCINNRYYVSFRSLDYNKGQVASVPGNTDSDEDGSDTESENPRALISIGDENETTIIAPGDAKRPINLTVINRGNNNRVALNITVSENVDEYVERMNASGSSVGDDAIRMKINASGISREEIERAERNVIKNRIKIQDNINDAIVPLGVRLSTLGKGCLLMCFRPKSWIYCRAFIMGLRLHNEKYLYIFKQLLTAFEQINDSNNLTMDVKISIGQLSEETSLSDCISGTEFKDIVQARDMDKTHQPFEKKDVGKRETTTDPRSGRSVGEDDKLSLKVVVRPVGDKSSLSSTDLEKVAVRTMEQVLEFKEEDVPYIPHTKTHDRMTTKGLKEAGVSYIPQTKTHDRSSKSPISDYYSESNVDSDPSLLVRDEERRSERTFGSLLGSERTFRSGRETESQHETNVDTCIPSTLLKHAQACKRNIHEVPRDGNSLFSALADQLTDVTFTGQSLRDHIETFISGRCPSEQQESLRLQKSNSRQDTGPTIQDAADFLGHPIVLYRDDENPPLFFQPNVDDPNRNFQILYIGCINNRYYVSFRSLDYNKGQSASFPGNTDSDEDGSDTESENPRAIISIGDENETTIIAPGDAKRPINLTEITRGNNNRVALNIIVPENVEEYVERMIASGSSEFKEADVPYIPHTKTHDRMTTKGSERTFRSDLSLLDADRELRSLLIEKRYFADQREFTPLQQLSIDDPDIDEALNTMKWNVFVISCGGKQLGTAFSLGPQACILTAGHVIGGSKEKYLHAKNERLSMETRFRFIGISSIADVGMLRAFRHLSPLSVSLGIDFGIESCTYIYVVGYVDGKKFLQGEKCPVLPPRHKDDGYIRFQSKLFHEGSSGSPCLVFKDGKFVVKGILVGREEGTDMPYELIAITFRCLWKRMKLA